MKYTDFYSNICKCNEGCGCSDDVSEYTGDTFSAPQPDFDRYDKGVTTDFQGTELDVKGYNPRGIVTNRQTLQKVEHVVNSLLEKNTPTSPDKWAKAKAAARAKFKVYPSAYANLWAAKKYKSMGGGWKKGKK